jgi:outer membrane protein assembly factor BamB
MAESIYSQPVVDGERLFIGDRRGYLHCLDTSSGEAIWRTQTAPDHSANVNATALIHGDLVLTANNEGNCLALDKASGKIVWQHALDGASTNEVQMFQNRVLVRTRHSIFGIDPESGQEVWRETWPGAQIWAMAVAGTGEDALIVVLTRELPTEEEGPSPKRARRRSFPWRASRAGRQAGRAG